MAKTKNHSTASVENIYSMDGRVPLTEKIGTRLLAKGSRVFLIIVAVLDVSRIYFFFRS